MKKIFIIFSACILLSGCSETEQKKSFVCTSEYERSTKETIYYYKGEEVESVLMKMSQVFSDEVVASRSEDEIIEDLKNSFLATVGEETQVEVQFDKKTKRAEVEILMLVEEMNERELKYQELLETRKIKEVMKILKKSGKKCK